MDAEPVLSLTIHTKSTPLSEAAGETARLEWVEGVGVLTALDAAVPARVNGEALLSGTPVFLNPGDLVQLGAFSFTWQPNAAGRTGGIVIAEASPHLPEPALRAILRVETPAGSQDFPLEAPAISLGRAPDNDIVINDKVVSRRHARLARVGAAYEIEDLGGANGLTLAGQRIQRRLLTPGDRLQITETVVLVYRVDPITPAQPDEEQHPPQAAQPAGEAPAGPETGEFEEPSALEAEPLEAVPLPEAGLAASRVSIILDLSAQGGMQTMLLDPSQDLDNRLTRPPVTNTLLETRTPHLVIQLNERTWDVPLLEEGMSIGRDEDNDICLPHSSVSRRHAFIEARGKEFVIKDEQSTNGVWLDDRRIERHILKDGETLRIGRALIVFKRGFSLDQLTLHSPVVIDGAPARRPVVFVPGFAGSELWLGSECLWPNPGKLISDMELLRLPGDSRVEPRRLLSEVVLIPHLIRLEQYNRLGDYLVGSLGYTRGKDLKEFAYDWRQDVRLSAQRLAAAIEAWPVQGPITLIAHSLGCLVSRYYVENLGGKEHVERLILLGGPHYGTLTSFFTLMHGPGLLPFGVGGTRMRAIMMSFPSLYQILPTYACATDQNGERINLLLEDHWLPEEQRPMLKLARSFRRELGTQSSVPAVSIFGYGVKTFTRVAVTTAAAGRWQRVDFVDEIGGDSTIPTVSAVLQKSEIHPVLQDHGSLYVDDDVRMRLKMELTRSVILKKRR
jgi:pSer/pThr/pTyr-binding forkhead associated (FHA) protein